MPHAAALVLVLVAAAPAEDLPFRTRFDPGERIEVSAGTAYGTRPLAGALSGALRLRSNRRGHSDPWQLWRRDHTILEAALSLPNLDFAVPRLEATAYQGAFVRRNEEGAVVIPAATPVRVPFPFDVGIALELARFAYDQADPDRGTLGVVRAAPLLDAARHVPGAYRCAFGPELSYALDLARRGAPRHRIVPFSGGVADLRFESDDGLWVGSLRGRVGWELEVGGPGRIAWGAALDLERTLVAVDDRPVAPYLRLEASSGGAPANLVGQVGLRLAAPL